MVPRAGGYVILSRELEAMNRDLSSDHKVLSERTREGIPEERLKAPLFP